MMRPRLRLRLADERGFTLSELVTVMAMLVLVLAALTTLLIAAMNTERELNRRFRSQINARLALDQLRREIHCASSVSGSASSVTIALGSRCPTAGSGTTVSWCALTSGTQWALYRRVGATCDATGVKRAEHLTTNAIFAFPAQGTGELKTLAVTLPVNATPGSGLADYRLEDDIVLRNSPRA